MTALLLALAVCGGSYRWDIKTLADSPRLEPVRQTTIQRLASLERPRKIPYYRLPAERQRFRVRAVLAARTKQADGDYHLILTDGRWSMVAEVPPECSGKRWGPVREAARKIRPGARVVVEGVLFFDSHPHARGHAPNAVELHPVTSIREGE